MENGFDTVSFIMDYEDGNLSFDEVVRGFQHLVDTGMILHLQGSYQGVAKRLLEAGYIKTSGPRQYETE